MTMHPSQLRLLSVLILAVLSVILLGGPAPVASEPPAEDADPALYEPGVVLVAFNPGPGAVALSESAREKVLRDYGAVQVKTIPGIDVQVVSVAEGRELETIRALERDPNVRYAEPNYLYHAFATPNDPNFSSQWAYPKIEALDAWDIVTGTTSIKIAIIDSGIDMGHPDLANKIVDGYDFVGMNGIPDGIPDDQHGHGTHVAGIAAAVTNNGVGVAGTSWGARIMPLRVLDDEGNGNGADIAAAINWAQTHGAKVANLSLGGPYIPPDDARMLQEAIDVAHSAGLLIVAAMGNKNTSTAYYPAAYANVLAVSATNEYDSKATYSNYGIYNDIAAPGGYYVGIYSTLPTYDVSLTPTKNYGYLIGTSQATPFVSGLAALIWSINPSLTPDQVQQIIQTTAVDLGTTGWDQYYGWGRINARAAIESQIVLLAPALYSISNPDMDGTYWVDWSDTLYATTYTLEEADNPAFTSPIVRYTGASSTALVTGRPNGTWYYRVRGERPSANKVSPWSSTVSTQVGLDTPVLQPVVNNGSGAYTVVWQAVTGATAYRLQESQDTAFATPTTLYEGASLSYAVSGRTGGTWYYRVQAYNSTINSLWSTIQSTTVLPAAPVLAPITLTPPDAYTLTWSTPAGATGYRLQEAADAAFTAPITRYLGINATYVVTGQPCGTWYYRVQAYNVAGYGPASNTRTVTVTTSLVPAPVLHPIVYDSGPTHYTVSWTTAPTATYTLEESRSVYFEAPRIAYTGTFTSYTAMDQASGPWHYRVRAHTTAGSSPWSNIQWVPAYVYLPLVARDNPSR